MPSVCWLFLSFVIRHLFFSISSDSSLSIDQSIFTLIHSSNVLAWLHACCCTTTMNSIECYAIYLSIIYLIWMCLFVVCFSIEPDSGFRFFNFYLCSALSILLNNHWIQIGTFGLAAPLYLFYPSLLYLTFFQTRSPCSCSFVFDRSTHTNSLRRSRCSISSLFHFLFGFPFFPLFTNYYLSLFVYHLQLQLLCRSLLVLMFHSRLCPLVLVLLKQTNR